MAKHSVESLGEEITNEFPATKHKPADDWKTLTATRETYSFTLKYYSSCDFDCNYADSDEEILVVPTNNWLIGCYSFLLEESSCESLSNDSAILCDALIIQKWPQTA